MSENFIEMELKEIQMHVEDFHRGTQIIVLGEKEGTRAFPIFIGSHEALALDMAAKGERAPRPLTHDLIQNTIDALEGTLERVLIVKLETEVFYGALEVKTAAGALVRIDSRPSDAIVLSTRRHVPIFVEESVLREVQSGFEVDPDDVEEE